MNELAFMVRILTTYHAYGNKPIDYHMLILRLVQPKNQKLQWDLKKKKQATHPITLVLGVDVRNITGRFANTLF